MSSLIHGEDLGYGCRAEIRRVEGGAQLELLHNSDPVRAAFPPRSGPVGDAYRELVGLRRFMAQVRIR